MENSNGFRHVKGDAIWTSVWKIQPRYHGLTMTPFYEFLEHFAYHKFLRSCLDIKSNSSNREFKRNISFTASKDAVTAATHIQLADYQRVAAHSCVTFDAQRRKLRLALPFTNLCSHASKMVRPRRDLLIEDRPKFGEWIRSYYQEMREKMFNNGLIFG